MAKVSYFLLCENYIFNDGKTTLVNVYDKITAPSLPALVKDFTLGIAIKDIEKSDLVDGKIKLAIEIFNKNNISIAKIETQDEIADTPLNVASGVDLGGKIQFSDEGMHTIKLSLGSKELTSLTFEVEIAEEK